MSRCYKQQIVLIQFYCILYLLLTTESLFVLQSVFHVFVYFFEYFCLGWLWLLLPVQSTVYKEQSLKVHSLTSTTSTSKTGKTVALNK